jgi:hypothetical protein
LGGVHTLDNWNLHKVQHVSLEVESKSEYWV